RPLSQWAFRDRRRRCCANQLNDIEIEAVWRIFNEGLSLEYLPTALKEGVSPNIRPLQCMKYPQQVHYATEFTNDRIVTQTVNCVEQAVQRVRLVRPQEPRFFVDNSFHTSRQDIPDEGFVYF